MGLKPKSRPVAKPKLDASEMADLMRKARGNDGEAAAEPAGEAVDHMPGLGFHAGSVFMFLLHRTVPAGILRTCLNAAGGLAPVAAGRWRRCRAIFISMASCHQSCTWKM